MDDDADDTAAVRHHVEGTVTKVTGDTGTSKGTITTVVCTTVPDGPDPDTAPDAVDETTSAIVSKFRVEYQRVSNDVLAVDGTFRFSPGQSTGTFKGLKGEGTLEGAFTCLGATEPVRDPRVLHRLRRVPR